MTCVEREQEKQHNTVYGSPAAADRFANKQQRSALNYIIIKRVNCYLIRQLRWLYCPLIDRCIDRFSFNGTIFGWCNASKKILCGICRIFTSVPSNLVQVVAKGPTISLNFAEYVVQSESVKILVCYIPEICASYGISLACSQTGVLIVQ